MRLLFKQRFLSWFDSYDIYDEAGQTLYTVKGQLAWGHLLKIYDRYGNEVGVVKEKLLTFLPKFEIYMGGAYAGCIRKEFTFFRPSFRIDFKDWSVEGNFLEWDYQIRDGGGRRIAAVSKQLLNWTDTYTLDVDDPGDVVCALMLVLAIDAEKNSRNS